MERASKVDVSALTHPLLFCPVAEHNELRLQATQHHPYGAWVIACQGGDCQVRLGDARQDEPL